ncbi:vacuolar membrane protein [Gonapodya prolifera JEL478]|uniref:Vacuolar transporter chaperone complex subunit 4 n=1 Tax=Gonapodya prolifera (strain JEL478) TaxID=1344416 RepID=A0A139ADG9_GONPJ|nr:vacuolar membrane protein [Gonapodya prolifera JEL478]|eukprot:KXS14634.1 vacuolar membrane protein [Gonapodya prolifera JEL478]
MKFGQQLAASVFPEWKYYYLDYDRLKSQLKTATSKGNEGISDQEEQRFVETLERELDKVVSFRQLKFDELQRHILELEHTVDRMLAQSATPPPGVDAERFSQERYAPQAREMDKIAREISELSKYARLNFTGFMKILKKHDKVSGGKLLKPVFSIRLNHRPFFKLDMDPLIIRLSKLFDAIRLGGKRNEELASAGGKQTDFVRKTVKYWVHPDNITDVKCVILKHLPVLVFQNPNVEPDPAITSIYFDNEQFDLYTGRLEKSEGAQAIRLRWYGRPDRTTEIFVERKTHHEDWTGEPSVKSRFSIKEEHVNAYLAGTYDYGKVVSKLRERGAKSGKELDEMLKLSTEVQKTVLEKKLVPMVRTFYNRTAFQLPGDARVRISLDTELAMIREDDQDGVKRRGLNNNWRRTDVGVEHPFDQVAKDDKILFPYAVLEVKLQTLMGAEAPQWIRDLIGSHLVEEVPKFSKFCHGIATLFDDRVSLLPFWLPQMGRDIRRPAPPEDQLPETLRLSSAVKIANQEAAVVKRASLVPQAEEIQVVVEQPSPSHDDDVTDERTPLLGGGGGSKKNPSPIDQFINMFSAPKPREVAPAPKSTSGGGVVVRVEPKVFFANERTFLSWLNFSVTLGGLSLGLLNFGDVTARVAGILFTLISLLVMLYATVIFRARATNIRARGAGPYDEVWGPTAIVGVLVAASIVNFWMKMTSGHFLL